MILIPNMLLIGAAGRDAGKTVFACEVIRRFREKSIQAAKVTAIQERDGTCPRGGEGCGVCSSLQENYCLSEETQPGEIKDTQRLLAAGAQRVLWLRVLKEHLEDGAQSLLDALAPGVPVLCESNSLRQVVQPGLFLMLRHQDTQHIKASADAVMACADAIVRTDGQRFDFNFERLIFANKQWRLADQPTTQPIS